jgi:hypothetical protein
MGIINRAIGKLGFKLVRPTPKLKDNEIAFLHIGKNAGTQVMLIANQLSSYGVEIKKYGHNTKLSSLQVGTPYFFSIRNPADRFRSGFYSRKRKGQPRVYSEWSKHEAIAFDKFEHANQLAEALMLEDSLGRDARAAIKSISHTGMQQVDFFQRCAFLQQQPPLTIIRQEQFEADMQRLFSLLGLNLNVSELTSNDAVKAHKNDYEDTPPLSDLAIVNLSKWYVQDYFFYATCEEWLSRT